LTSLNVELPAFENTVRYLNFETVVKIAPCPRKV